MTDIAGAAGSTLIAMVFALLVVGTVQGVVKRRQLVAMMAAQRARFFRNSIVNLSVLIAVGSAGVAIHPDLTAADVGWRLPEGNWSDYLYTGYVLVLLLAVFLRSRKGPLAPGTAALLPRTGRERRLAGGMAIAFGVGEEFLYRGLLLAAGTELVGLPLAVTAVLGWAFFVAAHAYQGWRPMIMVGVLGLVFTMLYLSSMSLLLPMLTHTLWDAVVLLLVRPRPAVAVAAEEGPAARETEEGSTAGESPTAEESTAVENAGDTAAAEIVTVPESGSLRLRPAAPD